MGRLAPTPLAARAVLTASRRQSSPELSQGSAAPQVGTRFPDVERLVTVANGTTLCIDEFPGRGDGPLVVQLEGHMAQHIATPESFCRKLAERGMRVVRVDNRDVGRSQRFPGVDYTLADLAEDVHGLIDVLGGPAIVCGRSMGGAVAQLLALTHRQDLLGLGLFFTFAKSTDWPPPQPATPAPFADEAGFVAWQRASLPGIAGPAHPFDDAYLDWISRAAWGRGVDWAGFERQRRAMAATPPWADRLAAVSLPVAIVHGANDPIVPVDAAYRLAQLLPHASVHIVAGLGHQQPPALDDLFVEATLRLA